MSWCESRWSPPELPAQPTSSIPLTVSFLESLGKNGTPTRIIEEIGPALCCVHKHTFVGGECAASSRPFALMLENIIRSVALALSLFLEDIAPTPTCRSREEGGEPAERHEAWYGISDLEEHNALEMFCEGESTWPPLL